MLAITQRNQIIIRAEIPITKDLIKNKNSSHTDQTEKFPTIKMMTPVSHHTIKAKTTTSKDKG